MLATHTQARTHARTHAHTHTSVCSGSCRPLRRSMAMRRRDALRVRRRGVTLQPTACNRRRAGWEQATGKRHHATGNGRHASCNVTTCQNGIGMDKRQEATEIARFATSNGRLATQNMYQARCDVDPSDRQRTPRDLGHWGGQQENGQEAPCSRHEPRNSNTADDTQGTTCMAPQENVQQAPRNVRRGKCNGRHAACNITRQVTCAMQWTTCNT
jgi:hypothetical protein